MVEKKIPLVTAPLYRMLDLVTFTLVYSEDRTVSLSISRAMRSLDFPLTGFFFESKTECSWLHGVATFSGLRGKPLESIFSPCHEFNQDTDVITVRVYTLTYI